MYQPGLENLGIQENAQISMIVDDVFIVDYIHYPGLKDLDTLEDAYKVMDQLNHFTQVISAPTFSY